VSSEEIVPSVTIDHGCSLAVDSDIRINRTLYLCTCPRIKLHHTDEAEICTVSAIETACSRVQEETCVDCVAILIHFRVSHFDSLCILEVRGIRIKSLVPHCENAASVSATESAACSTVSDEITVTYLDCIRSSSAAWTYSARVPVPAVL